MFATPFGLTNLMWNLQVASCKLQIWPDRETYKSDVKLTSCSLPHRCLRQRTQNTIELILWDTYNAFNFRQHKRHLSSRQWMHISSQTRHLCSKQWMHLSNQKCASVHAMANYSKHSLWLGFYTEFRTKALWFRLGFRVYIYIALREGTFWTQHASLTLQSNWTDLI